MTSRRRLLAGLAAALWACGGAAIAHASPVEEAMLQDDNHFVYATRATQVKALDHARDLGVQRLRITVLWQAVAPRPCSRTRPKSFDAADPAQYGAHIWDNYDRLVTLARARGLAINFNLTGPAPLWATQRGVKGACRSEAPAVYAPSAKEYGAFVKAVATRYSGSYQGLPRVSYWSVWNEPDQPGWLQPQVSKGVDVAPRLYRDFVDAAWIALHKTGHGDDTILVGELAPKGTERPKKPAQALTPLRFARDLYCLDRRGRLLSGKAAKALDCPRQSAARRFPALHPGLFTMTGFSTHPYSLLTPPALRSTASHPDYVTLADLPRLQQFLRATFARYGVPRPRVPIYLTEYGYQTKPPDPTQLYSPALVGAFLNQAEYIAYRNPLVRSLSQFLLYDDPPQAGPKRYKWSTFQSGLLLRNGKAKASYGAYRVPIWVPESSQPTTKSSRTYVWGSIRRPGVAVLQYRRARTKTWRAVKRVRVRNARGYVALRLHLEHSGAVRWQTPAKKVSRGVAVQVVPHVI